MGRKITKKVSKSVGPKESPLQNNIPLTRNSVAKLERMKEMERQKEECLTRQCQVVLERLCLQPSHPTPKTEVEKFNAEIIQQSKNLKPLAPNMLSPKVPQPTGLEVFFKEIQEKRAEMNLQD